MNEKTLAGRYTLLAPIASGGMATVHLGRLSGPAGFSRTVAIKRLHSHLCRSPDFVAMLLDEAHLAVRVRHPNVVSPIDVVDDDGELFLIMEYVHGVSLSYLLREARARDEKLPPEVAVRIAVDALRGLHAAHEAKNEKGERLGIVHRDVSPPNILIGVDGVGRMLDFGIAKARERHQTTKQGELKGKLSYMAPEQLEGEDVSAMSDVFSAAVCLWEALTCERLFQGGSDAELVERVLGGTIAPPSSRAAGLSKELDEAVMRGLRKSPSDRYASAAEMANALEKAVTPATPERVGELVRETARGVLLAREELLSTLEPEGFATVSVRGVVARLSSSPPADPISVPPPREELTTMPDPEGPAPSRDSFPPLRSSVPTITGLPIARDSMPSLGELPIQRGSRVAKATLTAILLVALAALVHRRLGAPPQAARPSGLSPAAVGPPSP